MLTGHKTQKTLLTEFPAFDYFMSIVTLAMSHIVHGNAQVLPKYSVKLLLVNNILKVVIKVVRNTQFVILYLVVVFSIHLPCLGLPH